MEENKLQQQIIIWYRNTFCLRHHSPRHAIFSVPNELAASNKIATIQAKSTGLMAGVSDLIIVRPDEVLFVEVKTATGRQSDKQKEFEEIVTAMGHRYILVRSLEDFKSLI